MFVKAAAATIVRDIRNTSAMFPRAAFGRMCCLLSHYGSNGKWRFVETKIFPLATAER
jgi:hypothetical protein